MPLPAWSWLLCMTLTLVTCGSARGKRVVMVPMPFTSHSKYHTNVARQLVQLGHRVWLTMPDYLARKGVLDTSLFTTLEYESETGNAEEISMAGLRDSYFAGQADDWVKLFDSTRHLTEALLQNQTFFRTIQKIDPDLVVLDNLPFMCTMVVIPYRLGKPFAFLGSAFDPVRQRVPISTAASPNVMLSFNDHMTFVQRLTNTLLYLFFSVYDHAVRQDAVARFAPEMPFIRMDMLTARAEMWLVEQDHILDYPNPSLPNVKFIGGTATGPARSLPPDFQRFMDSSPQGVVIVSFGSYVLHLPQHLSDKLFQVLLQLPMKAVFRSNLTSPDPNKIMTSPWLPQNDLLGHPHTKVFVSHCGKNGQYEALYHAVPVVAMPMFADQPYNAERVRVKGFAEVLDLRSCTAEELKSTIMTVATERRYKDAVAKASRLFRELFGVPQERAAWWLDHVMKHGGQYMRYAGQDMRLYQLMMLDVLLCIVLCAVFFLAMVFWSCRACFRLICKSGAKKKRD